MPDNINRRPYLSSDLRERIARLRTDPFKVDVTTSALYDGSPGSSSLTTPSAPVLGPQDTTNAATLFDTYREGLNDGKQLSGPSQSVANLTSLGTLGLGVASFFDDRKTAKLQREGLRSDIAAAKDHNQQRKAVRSSWNSGWNNG